MITLDEITLPDDLIFDNEFDCDNNTQSIDRSLTGVLIFQESSKIKGRKITLSTASEEAWIKRSTLSALKIKAETINLTMILTVHGTAYNVRFLKDSNGKAIDASPVYKISDPDVDAPYTATLNFIEV